MNEYKHGNWYCKPANEAEAKEIMDRAVASGAERYETVGDPRWDDCDAWGVIDGRTYTGGIAHAGQSFYGQTQYTIDKLRELFPLPGELPTIGSLYQHTNGGVYNVTGYANQKTKKPEQYPVTVIYKNVENGTIWCRPASEWARSFSNYDGEPSQKWNGEGLPPVGVECEMKSGEGWIKAMLIGFDGDSPIFKLHEIVNERSTQIKYMPCYLCTFRPLRTEREEFVEAAVKIHSAHQWTAESFAESLYDAIKSGALKAPEAE